MHSDYFLHKNILAFDAEIFSRKGHFLTNEQGHCFFARAKLYCSAILNNFAKKSRHGYPKNVEIAHVAAEPTR